MLTMTSRSLFLLLLFSFFSLIFFQSVREDVTRIRRSIRINGVTSPSHLSLSLSLSLSHTSLHLQCEIYEVSKEVLQKRALLDAKPVGGFISVFTTRFCDDFSF